MNEIKRPMIVEKYADNGEHSHWSVIDREDGKTIIEDIEEARYLENEIRMLVERRNNL